MNYFSPLFYRVPLVPCSLVWFSFGSSSPFPLHGLKWGTGQQGGSQAVQSVQLQVCRRLTVSLTMVLIKNLNDQCAHWSSWKLDGSLLAVTLNVSFTDAEVKEATRTSDQHNPPQSNFVMAQCIRCFFQCYWALLRNRARGTHFKSDTDLVYLACLFCIWADVIFVEEMHHLKGRHTDLPVSWSCSEL